MKRRSSENIRFDRFRANGLLTDTSILCGEEVFNVHGIIFAAASVRLEKIMTTMSSRPDRHSSERLVLCLDDLDELDPHIMHSLLDFLYTGEALLPPEKLDAFVELCDRLRLRGFDRESCFSATTVTSSVEQVESEQESHLSTSGSHSQQQRVFIGRKTKSKRRRESLAPATVKRQFQEPDLLSRSRSGAFDQVRIPYLFPFVS